MNAFFNSRFGGELFSDWLMAQAAESAPGNSINTIIVVAAVLLLLLLIGGFFLMRNMLSGETTDFSQSYRDADSGQADDSKATGVNELNPKAVSKSAETVSNEKDEAVVEELRSRFSSKQTVDATDDQSVVVDDEDD